MTTLDIKAGTTNQTPRIESTPAPIVEKSTDTAALITEQQVLLSSAAAVALHPPKTRRWSDTVHVVTSAVSSWLVSAAKPPTKPVYPKRHVWLETALMSREMDRL